MAEKREREREVHVAREVLRKEDRAQLSRVEFFQSSEAEDPEQAQRLFDEMVRASLPQCLGAAPRLG